MSQSLTKLAQAIEAGLATKLANMPVGGDALKNMLVGGAVASPLAYMLANHFNKQKMVGTRNKAFGAGMAAGIATPNIMQAISSRLNPGGGY